MNKGMSGADWLMLISLSLLWGGSFFFNDIAVRELPTITVVTVRVGLAAVVLLLDAVMALAARGRYRRSEDAALRIAFRVDVVRAVAVGAGRRDDQSGFFLGPGVDAVLVFRPDIVMAAGAADLGQFLGMREVGDSSKVGVAVDACHRTVD